MTRDVIAEARALIEPLTGYTPGPWQRVGWQPCGIYGPGDLAGAERIAEIDRRQDHDENTRLIAAAPTLRDTLAALLAHIEVLEAERDAALAEVRAMRESGSWFQEKDIDRLLEERSAALARAEALWSALDRLRPVPERLLRGVPVRDLSETLSEVDAALAGGKETP